MCVHNFIKKHSNKNSIEGRTLKNLFTYPILFTVTNYERYKYLFNIRERQGGIYYKKGWSSLDEKNIDIDKVLVVFSF